MQIGNAIFGSKNEPAKASIDQVKFGAAKGASKPKRPKETDLSSDEALRLLALLVGEVRSLRKDVAGLRSDLADGEEPGLAEVETNRGSRTIRIIEQD